ncbi:protein kinase family protein [Bacillus niameyensis]|uniref:protein kinase family protein n=1 Tax=Bacillus niameyensis TaxID=1522308 RepID=UPI000781234C|nr:protein kinase family protein [Bacillus niameyensis]
MFNSNANKWIGKKYGEYKIVRLLGEGRFGIGYLAVTDQGEKVVIKRFKTRPFKKNKDKNAYEAIILSQLENQAIPKLLGVISDKDLYAFILEYKPGHTVENMIFIQKYKFQQREIYDIGCQLISIMKYLHREGVVHRDIRIPNILISDSKVSLVDFGLARWYDGQNYLYDQDFSYLGDFLIYLHYTTFVKQQRKSLPWYRELELTDRQIHLYKRMLRLEEPFSSIDELERNFKFAF